MCMPSLLEVDHIGTYTVHSRHVTVCIYILVILKGICPVTDVLKTQCMIMLRKIHYL